MKGETMEGERLYKVLNNDGGLYHHDGTFRWSLPHDGQSGEWTPPIDGNLVACENAYHLLRDSDLLRWIGPRLYLAEYRGEHVDMDDKVLVREGRLRCALSTWNERTAQMFACDCAERVLFLGEITRPKDKRPQRAIEITRRYTNGKATEYELTNAADAAACSAVYAAREADASHDADAITCAAAHAADAAAYSAAHAAHAGVLGVHAAHNAHIAAAYAIDAIAYAYPHADAINVEKAWQTERLLWYLFLPSAS